MEQENLIEESEEFSQKTDSKKELVSILKSNVIESSPKSEVVVESKITFDKWFRTRSAERKFKPHWIKGMQKFTNVNGKKSMEEWDNIFKTY